LSRPEPAIHLASRSPRRRQLLAQVGIPFQTLSVDVPERVEPGEAPEHYVERVARAKAEAGVRCAPAGAIVLGADTDVVLEDRILGKPADRDDARVMLRALADRWHRVISGVALSDGDRTRVRLQVSEVRFAALDEATIDAYWDSGEPRDKAGAYAIQGLGAAFVADLRGSFSGVMGLPLFETLALCREFGVPGLTTLADTLRASAALGATS